MKHAAHSPPRRRDQCSRVFFFVLGTKRLPRRCALLLLIGAAIGFPHPLTAGSHKEKDKPSAARGNFAPPTFSHSSGCYEAPFELTLRTTLSDAILRFTTDGSEPTATNGTRYSKPIPLSRTTVLRAATFPATGAPSEIISRSFLFPSDLLRQKGEGFPSFWGIRDREPVRAHYKLDTAILDEAGGSDAVSRALRSLPVISIQANVHDLFDTDRGLYANPMLSGSDWERPGSVELLNTGTQPGFQIQCGLRIQGGWNRRPEECPKHSIRLVFRKKYGAGSLHHPLFGDQMKEFDELILRGGCNNTWLHWNADERKRGDYLRDQWMRDSYRELGHLSARGKFVHLYLNGLYWGIYNLVERPAGPFIASHLGGKPADYDVRNSDHVLEGDAQAWEALIQLANRGLQSNEAFQEIQHRLDLPAFIDYMLLNLYGANADYDRASNWYAARPRSESGRFVFLVWDGERTLESATNNAVAYDDDQSPPRLFQKLRENIEFRNRFSARAHEVLGSNGVLSAVASSDRYRQLSETLEPAILLESARWGTYRNEVHPYKVGPYERYTLKEHWRPEIDRMLDQFFPQRTLEFLKQLREAELLGDSAPK